MYGFIEKNAHTTTRRWDVFAFLMMVDILTMHHLLDGVSLFVCVVGVPCTRRMHQQIGKTASLCLFWESHHIISYAQIGNKRDICMCVCGV